MSIQEAPLSKLIVRASLTTGSMIPPLDVATCTELRISTMRSNSNSSINEVFGSLYWWANCVSVRYRLASSNVRCFCWTNVDLLAWRRWWRRRHTIAYFRYAVCVASISAAIIAVLVMRSDVYGDTVTGRPNFRDRWPRLRLKVKIAFESTVSRAVLFVTIHLPY